MFALVCVAFIGLGPSACGRSSDPSVYAGGSVADGQVVTVGDTWTYGTPQILNRTGKPIEFRRLDLVRAFGRFHPIAIRLAGPNRGENVLAAPGFPPNDHDPASYGKVDGFVAPPDPAQAPAEGNWGTEVVIALRMDSPGNAGFAGLRLTYLLDGESFVLEVPDSFVACTQRAEEGLKQAGERCGDLIPEPVGKTSVYVAGS